MSITGEISVRPEEFAAAVAWVAKWVTAKPVVPIQAGIAIEAGPDGIALTAYSENVTARAKVAADGMTDASGTTVVSGRLLAALAATFGKGKAVALATSGSALHIASGKWKGTLPTMADQDWPTLPTALPEIGRCGGQVLADEVARIGVAAGTDPAAGAVFMLMHLGLGGDRLELGATDRYRVALTSIPFEYAGSLPFSQLTPFAEHMVEAAGAFAGPDHVTVGADPGALSLTNDRRQIVMRLGSVEGGWPATVMHGYIDKAMAQAADTEIKPEEIAMPLKRAGITGGKGALARVRISGGVMAIGGADDDSGADGDEEIEVDYDGPAGEGYFNTRYLGDAFATAPGKVTRIKFGTDGQMRLPVLTFCDDDPHWRYITMPIRKN